MTQILRFFGKLQEKNKIRGKRPWSCRIDCDITTYVQEIEAGYVNVGTYVLQTIHYRGTILPYL
jgi:hypothetical protein